MNSKNICYVILTCDKNKDRRTAIEQTWGKQVQNKIIWLTDSLTPVLGYESCPHKYLAFFKSYKLNNYDWFVFVDDDTYVNVSTLEASLQTSVAEPTVRGLMIGEAYAGDRNVFLYSEPTSAALQEGKLLTSPCKLIYITGPKAPPGGYFLDCYGIYTSPYPADFAFPHGGAGIVLNSEAVQRVAAYVKNTPDVPMSKHSDVSLAVWLKKMNVSNIIDDTSFNNGFRGLNEEIQSLKSGKTFTCHYVSPENMYHLYRALQSPLVKIKDSIKKYVKKMAKYICNFFKF